jgi:type I restriction enzyme S subunit
MQKLGDYIREVNVRNKDLKVTNLLGLSMSKQFRPSTSNIVGVDLSNYKVVRNNVFAFDPMSVIRVHKVPIALNDTDFPIIVSPAYITFECIDVEKLDPKYLMMWFQRTEFDRYADFKSDAAVRGGYDWKELCETLIIIPSIEQQREIVSEYETISKRIKLNEQIIKNLEATAQTLYHKMFVEGIDKENLPEGWRIGKFTEVVKISGGGTPDTSEIMYWNGNIPFFTPADSTNAYYCIKTEKKLSMLGFDNCSSKMYKKDTTFVTARGTVGEITLASMDMAMNQSCYALLSSNKEIEIPYYIHQFAVETIASLKEEAVGAVFNALVTKDFEVKEVIIPSIEIMVEYNLLVKPLYQSILIRQKENSKLTELQSLLLAKMGR